MRMVLRSRRVVGVLLCIFGLALLTWSASAALGLTDATRAVPASPSSAPAERAAAPSAVEAQVAVAGPLGVQRVERVAIPSLPGGTLLPSSPSIDSGALPMGTRVAVDLTSVAHGGAARASPGSATSVQEQRVHTLPGASLALAASAFTLAGLAAYFWTGLKTWGYRLAVLPFLPLYARITRAEVFDNSVRERIFRAIKDTPGLSASELAKGAGVSWGTTIYHLDVLEQNRMVSSLRSGRHRRYFENGAALLVPKQAVAILHNAMTAQVATSIQAAPGATQKELAGRVGLTPQALHWHLQRLVQAGLVRKQRDGRVVRHFVQA